MQSRLVQTTCWLGLGLAALAAGRAGAGEAAETAPHRDARMQWWREARFGMFIHWGVYSVPAGTYRGERVKGIGEWIMHHGKIPMADYRLFARDFNPVKFDADRWVRIAKDAGMRYIIITAKHHDGFAMFHSRVSPWNIHDATPFNRDPLAELAAACRKHGMPLGFYYSQAQDWNHPGGAARGGHWDEAQDGDMDEYLRTVAVPQVRELLTNYGPIAVLWWDTPINMTPERAEMLVPLLKLQPGIITNNRLAKEYPGDTETPEQRIPATGYQGRDWETCMTMNDTWGYKSYDDHWKDADVLIRNLVDIASKGGNYLLNVGPTAEGVIPQPSVERLDRIGAWMRRNGGAIYATQASPFKRLPWGRCTQKPHDGGTTLFLHVFDWPADGRLVVPGLGNEPVSAHLLSDAERPLPISAGAEGPVIGVPAAAPDAICSVVVLEIEGRPEVAAALPGQAADGSITLAPIEAICHGAVRFESGAMHDTIGSWTDPEDSVEWRFRVTAPGTFDVSAQIAAPASSGFHVVVGDRRLRAEVPVTGGATTFKTFELGTIEIPAAGAVALLLRPIAEGWRPMTLRSLELTPVKP